MKTLLIILTVILMFTSLVAQNYTFVRGSFNTAGGFQQNSSYSTQTAVGEYVQGNVASASYDGYLGFLFPLLDQKPPIITSIDDVPNDQGRKVQIVWTKCAFDDVYAMETFYSIWRLDEDFDVLQAAENGLNYRSKNLLSENIFTEPLIIIEMARENSNKTYFWQRDDEVWTFVTEVPALNYNEYSYIASTLLDSSNVETNYSTFKVVYHDDFEYYESAPNSGYSVDDIAPDATRATISQNGSNIQLLWEEVEYGTFEGNRYPEINGIWYKVYASDTPDFACDEFTYLITTTDLDYDFPLSSDKKFFRIVVSDKP